jgi:hypothetical protein
MKKTILIFLFAAGTMTAFSQGVSFGIKAGANLAKETAKYQGLSVSTDSKVNFMAGVYLTAMISSKIGIQPEVLYSGQGGQITQAGTTFKDKFAYLNVPVLLRYQIVPMFSIHIGPQFGILMSAKSDDGSGNGYQDVKAQYKSSDVALAIGAALDLPGGFNFGVRYVDGLSNIYIDTSSGTVKNGVWQLNIGFKLFGKK